MNKLFLSLIFAAAIAGCNTDNRTTGDHDNRDTVVIQRQAPAPATTQTPQGKDSEVKIKVDKEGGLDLEIKRDRKDD